MFSSKTTPMLNLLTMCYTGCVMTAPNLASFSPVAAQPPSETVAIESPDRTISGWHDIKALNPDFVVFGEYHGTAQSPAFIGQLALHLLEGGDRVLLAIEISAEDNDRVQSIWAGPHEEFERRMADHLSKQRDGNGSVAMVRMLTALHDAKTRGASISIVAFNGYKDSEQRERLETGFGQQGHDAAQAENILAAARAGSFDHVLVLVGEAHARKVLTPRPEGDFEPMALQLSRSGTVVSLRMETAGGSAWGCLLDPEKRGDPTTPVTVDMLDCDSHPVRGSDREGGDPYLALGPFDDRAGEQGFDGYYWLGNVTSSPPVGD